MILGQMSGFIRGFLENAEKKGIEIGFDKAVEAIKWGKENGLFNSKNTGEISGWIAWLEANKEKILKGNLND